MNNMTPGLLIAAPASGTGKTTLTLGLMRHLRRQGKVVQPYKCGPDYIDPAFHAAACGRDSINMDSWAMAPATLTGHLSRASDADIILAEGSMGLFDGVVAAGETGNGASADIAALAGWPVVLVIDASGAAQSAAAVAKGFTVMRDDIHLAGVVLNKVASPRHEKLLRLGMEQAGIRVLGVLPRRADIEMPERHLGLVQASEYDRLEQILDDMADLVADHVDVDAILVASNALINGTEPVSVTPPGQRIALARDAAFTFVYPHQLDGWRKAGAEILPFSPLADEKPDDSADCCWLAGGYPELHAGKLAAATNFQAGLRAFSETRPVHGECGGYMVLGTALTDKEGTRHNMTGLLGLETSFAKRKFHLGYRLATLDHDVIGYRAGQKLRGHEFHYTTILNQPDESLATVVDANGDAVAEGGSRRGHVTGTFFHLIGAAS